MNNITQIVSYEHFLYTIMQNEVIKSYLIIQQNIINLRREIKNILVNNAMYHNINAMFHHN